MYRVHGSIHCTWYIVDCTMYSQSVTWMYVYRGGGRVFSGAREGPFLVFSGLINIFSMGSGIAQFNGTGNWYFHSLGDGIPKHYHRDQEIKSILFTGNWETRLIFSGNWEWAFIITGNCKQFKPGTGIPCFSLGLGYWTFLSLGLGVAILLNCDPGIRPTPLVLYM